MRRVIRRGEHIIGPDHQCVKCRATELVIEFRMGARCPNATVNHLRIVK